jgi:N-acetylmuramoyl-L-alanine amidase
MILLDAGHGGYVNGKYVSTHKQFKHASGFHKDGWFYEGVWNRTFTDKVADRLKELKIPFTKLYHPSRDTSLTSRIRLANSLPGTLLISNHANASPRHNARGFEILTSPGRTKSDNYAKKYLDMYDLPYRNRGHKEGRFTILSSSRFPSMIVEHLFFDEINDATALITDIDRMVDLQVKFIEHVHS